MNDVKYHKFTGSMPIIFVENFSDFPATIGAQVEDLDEGMEFDNGNYCRTIGFKKSPLKFIVFEDAMMRTLFGHRRNDVVDATLAMYVAEQKYPMNEKLALNHAIKLAVENNAAGAYQMLSSIYNRKFKSENPYHQIAMQEGLMSEASGDAGEEAKRKNLVHTGYGYYGPKEKGDPTHKSVDDGNKLEPISAEDLQAYKDRKAGKTPSKVPDQPTQSAAAPPAEKETKILVKKDTGEKVTDPEKIKAIVGGNQPAGEESEPVEGFEPYGDAETAYVPGKLNDGDDELSDGEIKQIALDGYYQDDFKPAPGSATSMVNEILSGEVQHILENDPSLINDPDKMAQILFEIIEHKGIYNDIAGSKTISKKSRTWGEQWHGKSESVVKLMMLTARAGIEKQRDVQRGLATLAEQNKMSGPTKLRTYYGHEVSIQKQVELIQSLPGPFYTNKGHEINKEDLIHFIKVSGGGENPSDTSTIVTTEDGKAMITFHSDKTATKDPQANTRVSAEWDRSKQHIDNLEGVPDRVKTAGKKILTLGQAAIAKEEEKLKNISQTMIEDLKVEQDPVEISNFMKNSSGGKDPAKYWKKAVGKPGGKVHSKIRKYLPGDSINVNDYTDDELAAAFMDFIGDPDKEGPPTGDQQSLIDRTLPHFGYDISAAQGKIRERSIKIQQDLRVHLNKLGHNLGDYIELKNMTDALHIGLIDGENSDHGVSKYPGLMNLNMGGVVAGIDEIQHCLGVDSLADFESNVQVDAAGDYTKNKQGQTTGQNVFVYIMVKGKKQKVARKSQRSKTGPGGKLDTIYYWSDDVQKCFKGQQDIKNKGNK